MDQIITDFHFVRPLWLLAFLPAITLIIVLLRQKNKQGQWHQFLPPHLAKVLIETTATSKKIGSSALIIIASALISIALAGPTWDRVEQPLFKVKQAQVIIADMSLSMYATDVLPNRLTRAKFKIKDLVSRLSEGETALIAYAGDAFVISPMTQDVANLQNLIPSLTPEIMPVYGSRPSWAVEKALELLEQTNYKQGTLYLITDGIEPSDAREITRLLKNTQFTLNILGIGTQQGAPIRLPNGQLLKNDIGNIVIPKLQSSILRGLSSDLSGRYSNLTNDQADIDYLAHNVQADEFDSEQQDNQFGDEWHEVGPYLILILLPFAAYAFRRGVITVIAMTIMLYPLSSPPMMANSVAATTLPAVQPKVVPQSAPVQKVSWWNDLWQTQNQQGLTSYKNEDFSYASSQFEDSQWRGTAHYKQGNFEQALEHFNQSSQPSALYNQGNTLARLEQYDDAISRYKDLLKQDPKFPNAQDNLELVTQLAAQQEKKKKQQEKKDNQNKEDGDKQQSPDDKDKGDDNKDDGSSQQDKKQNGEQGQEDNKKGNQQDKEKQSQDESEEKNDSESQSKSEKNGDKKDPLSEQEKQKLAKQQQDAKQKQQMFNKDNLTPEELQRLNRLVKKIPDDPSLLLKNKMALEARKRQHQRVSTKERKQW